MLKKIFYIFLTGIIISCSSTGKIDPNEAINLNEAISRSAKDIMSKIPPNTVIAFFNISESDFSMLTGHVIEEISVILVDMGKLIVRSY